MKSLDKVIDGCFLESNFDGREELKNRLFNELSNYVADLLIEYRELDNRGNEELLDFYTSAIL